MLSPGNPMAISTQHVCSNESEAGLRSDEAGGRGTGSREAGTLERVAVHAEVTGTQGITECLMRVWIRCTRAAAGEVLEDVDEGAGAGVAVIACVRGKSVEGVRDQR